MLDEVNEMKVTSEHYKPEEMFKILREWSGLTQEEFGNLIGKNGRSWAKGIERGVNRFYFSDIYDIAKKLNITITFEKK